MNTKTDIPDPADVRTKYKGEAARVNRENVEALEKLDKAFNRRESDGSFFYQADVKFFGQMWPFIMKLVKAAAWLQTSEAFDALTKDYCVALSDLDTAYDDLLKALKARKEET